MEVRQMTSSDIPLIWTLWNEQVEETYRLQDRLMTQVINCQDFDPTTSFVAIKDNHIIGAIVIKRWQRTELSWYQNKAWMSLLVVSPAHQKQGVASTLLQRSIIKLKQLKYTVLHAGKGMNPLFCGLPSNWDSIEAMKHLGFTSPGFTYDMHHHIKEYTPLPLRHQIDYTIRLATPSDFDAIHTFFARCFPGRWQQEFIEYVENGGDGKEFAIMTYQKEVIAFCRINHPTKSQPMYNTNFSHNFKALYGVGPLGVDSRFRGHSLGYDVTAYTINQAAQQGATDIIIDWTSHVEFYQKFGFDIWREYVVLDYNL